MSDYDFLRAPWSGEEVDALNRYQRRDDVHEFTCPQDHDGADPSLVATRQGWICPHCDYRQDWAHRAMLTLPEKFRHLPCDVMLPPATIIRKGCDFSVLMTGFMARETAPPESNRFNDPAANLPLVKGEIAVEVQSADYNYSGRLAGIAIKKSGAVRYVVEDANRRLFIHNARQIGRDEGWVP
jgi:hypothetical protein